LVLISRYHGGQKRRIGAELAGFMAYIIYG